MVEKPPGTPEQTPSQEKKIADPAWAEYKRTDSVTLRNQLVERYLPLVDSLAKEIHGRLPTTVQLGDVHSAGILGLIDAVEKFDPNRDIKFRTYCTVRVRGAILDYLRSVDHVPRLTRARVQKFAIAVSRLERELGHPAAPDEIMKGLSITPEKFYEIQADLARIAVYSLSASEAVNGEGDGVLSESSALIDRKERGPLSTVHLNEALKTVLGGLTEKERTIMVLYYLEDIGLKTIGKRLGVSESRICQIHGEILKKLAEEFRGRAAEFIL